MSRSARRPQRLVRTILLGSVAVVLAIVWLARELDLDTDELFGFFLTSLMLVGLCMALAVAGWAMVAGVRRLLQRRSGGAGRRE